MDSVDYQILACLKQDARASATHIGSQISLSTSAVIERIKKLESIGLIQQYTTIIDQNVLGRNLIAYINVRLEHPKYYENFVETVNANNSIAECYYIAGDFDFLLKILTQSGKKLEEILTCIKSINGVSMTRTSVVLSTNKCDVSLLPDEK